MKETHPCNDSILEACDLADLGACLMIVLCTGNKILVIVHVV